MDPWLSFKLEIKPSASGRSEPPEAECEEETLTFWIRTRLWLSPAHQKQPALESAPVVLVWFNYRRGLCLIGVYVGHYTQQTQCVFTSSAGYIRRFGWWWKKFHLRITDVFFLPLSFVWSLPPSPSFSLPLSLSLSGCVFPCRSLISWLLNGKSPSYWSKVSAQPLSVRLKSWTAAFVKTSCWTFRAVSFVYTTPLITRTRRNSRPVFITTQSTSLLLSDVCLYRA